MKSLCLYIVILATLIKSIASFSCEDIYLDSKNTLYKATRYYIFFFNNQNINLQ